MASNAEEYADSLSASIHSMTDAGAPFGWANENTGEWIDYDPATKPTYHGDPDEWQEASATDYLSDALDIQYLVGTDRQYRSARVLIAFGGPNAFIDTRTGQLEVAWWGPAVFRDLPREFISGLDDALSELWEMGA